MPQTGMWCQVSPVKGSGMKPSRLTAQMKSISVATYGNQRPIAFDGRDEREGAECQQRALHAGGLPKYVTSESPSSTVYASAYVIAAASPSHGSETATAKTTIITAMARNI